MADDHNGAGGKRRRDDLHAGVTEERLMGIIGSATDAIITVDDAQKITLFNSAAERMFRCPAAEALGQPLDRFIPQRFRGIHHQHIRVFGQTGVTARAMASQRPLAALRSDGVEFPVEATISQITIAGQRLFTAIVRDVSERKRVEEALRESEGRLRAIVDTAVDGIITIDEQGRITSFNPAAMKMFGYEPDEVMGKNINRLMPPPYHLEHDGYLSNYQTSGVKKIIGIGREVTGRRKDGTDFPMDLAVSETRLDDRRIFTGIVRDISERKRAEVDRERLLRLLGLANMLIRGGGDKIIHWNLGAARLYGYTATEAVGRISHELLKTEFPEPLDKIQQRLHAEGRWEGDLVHTTRDGRKITVVSEWTLFPAAAGEAAAVLEVNADVTQRKAVERALATQAEELARSNVELERFAYIASHDLQEPMRTVHSFAQLLQRRYGQLLEGDGADYIGFITDGVHRMQTLILDLLAYSRVNSQGAAFAKADCNEILDKVLGSLQAAIQSQKAEVTAGPLPVVAGDATQLGQVFQNLLSNAMKFHDHRPLKIQIAAKETPLEWIFSVTDNGIGIDEKYYERIFIIFQRLHTIEEYGGTGIGLAICKKIVGRHGGRIWVESRVGEGCAFFFTIPRKTRSA